jgi:hypothetical protein
MELTNQSVNIHMNKTATILTKVVEDLLGCGHTLWTDSFYKSPGLARFVKSKKTVRWHPTYQQKNVPPVVKAKN